MECAESFACAKPLPAGRRRSAELADVVKQALPLLLERQGLSIDQWRAVDAILNCRTKQMGAFVSQCEHCEEKYYGYCSCGNRHCPKCQHKQRYDWIRSQLADCLPIPYYHVVFTLPHELNALALYNKSLIYNLLFQCAAQTLQAFSKDEKYLGAELGFTSILHTWGQALSYHIHLHVIVSGGGWDRREGTFRRLPYQKKFLFPTKAMSVVMKSKFLSALRAAYEQAELTFDGELKNEAHPIAFEALCCRLYEREWITYAKAPFCGPAQVLKYLGNYTHKVAISNSRLQSVEANAVTFRYKDYRDGHQQKIMKLAPLEFLRRFLMHVLPKGFKRIRHYGILAPSYRRSDLDAIKEILTADGNALAKIAAPPIWQMTCPSCEKGVLHFVLFIPGKQLNRLDSS